MKIDSLYAGLSSSRIDLVITVLKSRSPKTCPICSWMSFASVVRRSCMVITTPSTAAVVLVLWVWAIVWAVKQERLSRAAASDEPELETATA